MDERGYGSPGCPVPGSPARDAFAGLLPASAAALLAGIAAILACCWPVVSHLLLLQWAGIALFMPVGVWLAGRALLPPRPVGRPRQASRARQQTVTGLSLAVGLFWGLSGWILFPDGVPQHQILLALAVTAMVPLWLPVFVLEPGAMPVMAAPAVLPVTLRLLSSDDPAVVATGGALLVFLIGFFAAAQSARRLAREARASQRGLHYRATHDGLVDLLNHSEFHNRLTAIDGGPDRPYAVLAVDLDHFKEVNDAAGHAAGDRLLRQVAGILRCARRRTDSAGRLGGDEFAILMIGAREEEAIRVARSILHAIEGLAPPAEASDYRITASIGIATAAERYSGGAEALRAADRACYAAKVSGRNCLQLARGTLGSEEREAREQQDTTVVRLEDHLAKRAAGG